MLFTYQRLNVISDSRGVVFEPLEAGSFPDQKNGHVVISGPGVVRGNHYHIKGEETIAVKGPALVRARDDAGVRDVEIPDGEVYRFFFPPGVAHAIRNVSERSNMLIAFNTMEHDPRSPDAIEDILF